MFQKTYKIDIPVLIDPVHSLSTKHQFRTADKSKWLGGHFKAGSKDSVL